MSPTRVTPDEPRPAPRRSVNIVAFICTGVVLGVIGGGIVDLLGPAAPTYNNASSLAFLAAVGALIGALAGGLLGSALDVMAERRR
ncbi:hypothetical protein [Gephyromycinifex aptenodytis]|uniref:hypothetical protein n=1 Tax=Gephyromycinifex aptenodytis TaxID=2716227 RepID=UPI0014483468|nr:hypothetical protein [Gephyromycinifex aptenodytis]